MEDNQIIQLYFDRSEDAISQTAVKYGKYCHTIAYNANMGMGVYKDKGDYKPEPLPRKGGYKGKKTGSAFFNAMANKLGGLMFFMSKGSKGDKACLGAAGGLDVLGLNYASSRYDEDVRKYPDRLMVGSETMVADLPYNWERVKKYPQVLGDFVWSAWDYLGEACIGDWTYHSYKGLPLLAGQGMIDITGKPLASMYYMQIVWGLRKEPFIGVRPLNHAKEEPSTGAWQFTNAIDSWSWQGYEGKKAVVEVYFSGENNELAYATSRFPDRDFRYRGVIISNSDLGYKGNTIPKAPAGTIHGGIECVNGQWYVFYHRSTNNTDFSRQACAEPITILPDGSIPQVEITTQGISGKPIPAKGSIPAAYACHLTTGKTIKLGIGKQQTQPRIDESEGEVYVADLANNTQLGYKYFDFRNIQRIGVTYRGAGEGLLEVRTQENGNSIGTIPIQPSLQWTQASGTVNLNGVHALYLQFRGKGRIDLKTVTFSEEDTI